MDNTSRLSSTQWSVAKRTTELLAADGFTAVPSALLKYAHKLQLTSSDLVLLIHLLSFKWDEKNPFPSVGLIAERMDMTPTAVRQHARKLESKGLLRRLARTGTSNEFDLNPLLKKLEEFVIQDDEVYAIPADIVPPEILRILPQSQERVVPTVLRGGAFR